MLTRSNNKRTAPSRPGNIHQTPIRELANSPEQQQFGRAKEVSLPEYCRRCRFLFACNGGCPKNRFLRTPDGQPGGNFLCQGLRMFFDWIIPAMQAMLAELRAGRPAAAIIERLPAR